MRVKSVFPIACRQEHSWSEHIAAFSTQVGCITQVMISGDKQHRVASGRRANEQPAPRWARLMGSTFVGAMSRDPTKHTLGPLSQDSFRKPVSAHRMHKAPLRLCSQRPQGCWKSSRRGCQAHGASGLRELLGHLFLSQDTPEALTGCSYAGIPCQ